MAYAASQPVKEVPGFARVGQAVRKGVLAALNPLFGTPENPTKLGRAMALAEEASQYGLSVGPAAAVGRVRYNPHPVRGTRIVDKRFLGDMTIPLQNRQAASSVVAAPKSMFSNSPGNMVLITEHNGQVILPREADVRLYSSERVVLPDGRKIKLEELPSIVSDLDASSMSREAKQKRVAQLNAAVTPQWMYRMYQKDMADLRATLKAHRAGNRFYDNEGIKMYDVLSRGDAASIISEPVGTKFQMRTKDLGNVTFSPNHVSDMTHDRFVKDPRLYEAYNDGFLPYQSLTLLGSPYTVRGKTVTPALRVTDHHEILRDAAGSLLRPGTAGLSVPEYREYKRTYNIGRDIPYFGIKPVEPGGVDLMYHLDNGQNVIRANGAYSASVAVQQASKGGDSPHRNFKNFLATDKVPESIFGYPVVQRTEDYTPEDVEFFRANPKAAGFYDLGDGMDEEVPQQGAWFAGKSAKDQAGAALIHQYREEQDPVILRMKSAQHNGLTGAPRLVSRSSTRYFADTNYRRGATWVTPADSEFGEVEYFLDVANGEGDQANRVVVRTPTGVTPDWARRFAQYLFRHHERGDKRFGAITEDDIGREVWLHAAALADSNNLREKLSSGSFSALGGGGLDRFVQAATSDYLRKHAEFTDIMHADPKLGRLEAVYGKWEDQ